MHGSMYKKSINLCMYVGKMVGLEDVLTSVLHKVSSDNEDRSEFLKTLLILKKNILYIYIFIIFNKQKII